MYQDEDYNPVDQNDYDNTLTNEQILEQSKKMDKGYNSIYRKIQKKDGTMKNKKIDIYTSSGTGSHIRDAETGQYYPNFVGSKDEDLFFKVGLSTGECKSANGSNTLFFLSPQHYADHLHVTINNDMVSNWESKRDARLAEIKREKSKFSVEVV